MTCYLIDPLLDPRWPNLIERHPASSIFHTIGWLTALQRTYGFEPVAITTTPPDRELKNAIVLCRVRSWLTGRRLVSLPFSDHCEPLVEDASNLIGLLAGLQGDLERRKWRYVELRSAKGVELGRSWPGWQRDSSYCLHTLDLHPSLEEIFARFHKDCIQRKIRRAERDGLKYECGRSEMLLKRFYDLQVQTRQRHGLPPQPLAWFRNLIQSLGGNLQIRIASLDETPVAGMITLINRSTMVYKYGCSDRRLDNHGGMQLLFWKAIQDAKSLGMAKMDLGRSHSKDTGLLDFKDRWGASRILLQYERFPSGAKNGRSERVQQLAELVFSQLPARWLIAMGALLYRHLG